MIPSELNSSRIALLLCIEHPPEQDEWFVFYGTCRWDGATLHFDSRSGRGSFPFAVDSVARIRPTDESMRGIREGELFGKCDCFVGLATGPLADDEDPLEYLATNLGQPSERGAGGAA